MLFDDVEVEKNSIDIELDDSIKYAKISQGLDALNFWRKYEKVLSNLACLARKYLSIQASSAAVERMFSVAGHIFSLKRRRLGDKFFFELVFFKIK